MSPLHVKSPRKKSSTSKTVKQKNKNENNKIVMIDENGFEEDYIYDEIEGAYVRKKAIDDDAIEIDNEEMIY